MEIKRTDFLKTAIGATAGVAAVATVSPWRSEAETEIGNFPAGTTGSSIFVGLCTPFTGSYSADGEDQHKGFVLAIEDLNNGTGVMAKMPSLAGKKGLLGKKIVYRVADSETKPDVAVQRALEFITQNKAILIVGGLASSSDIALEKLAQQQKVLYMMGPSGSNDTTGIDCQRYTFRSQPDGYMVARALDPYLIKEYGRNRKCIFLLPDYSYGHSMADSLATDLQERGGWTTVAKVVAPFPTSDYSSYLTNIINTDAEVFLNIEYGIDGVTSTKQAVQFGIMKKMKLVVPNMSSYLPDGLGPEIMQGNLGVSDWYWGFADRFPLSKIFLDSFLKRFPGVYPRWTAHVAYSQLAMWADAVAHVKTFNPVTIIKYLEQGNKVNLMLGDIYYRAGDHDQVRPVPVLRGKSPAQMKNKVDFFDVVALVPGEQVMQPLSETGCKMPPYT